MLLGRLRGTLTPSVPVLGGRRPSGCTMRGTQRGGWHKSLVVNLGVAEGLRGTLVQHTTTCPRPLQMVVRQEQGARIPHPLLPTVHDHHKCRAWGQAGGLHPWVLCPRLGSSGGCQGPPPVVQELSVRRGQAPCCGEGAGLSPQNAIVLWSLGEALTPPLRAYRGPVIFKKTHFEADWSLSEQISCSFR